MNKDKNFVSAVVYVCNAGERIEQFLRTLISFFEENFEHSEIICVNDKSQDESADIIRRVGTATDNTLVTLLNMSSFYGQELAMHAGVDLAIGDYVFEFDTTVIDYEPGEIMRVYDRVLDGYDIVSASPDRKIRFSSRMFYNIFARTSVHSCKMTTEAFRVLSRRVINRISSMNKTMPYRKVVYASCGLMTDNIVYHAIGEGAKPDKREGRYRRNLALNALIMFTNVGYRFSLAMTVVMMCFSLAMIVYTLACFFTINPVAGWTTTILFLSIAFFGLFAILTVIIKYLQVLTDLVFKKTQYSFESIEKLAK